MRERKPQWPMFRAVGQRAGLLDDVLDAMGISPRTAVGLDDGAAFYEARSMCIACACSRECRAWLDTAPREGVGTRTRAPPAFCPNGHFIVACRSAAGTMTQASKQ